MAKLSTTTKTVLLFYPQNLLVKNVLLELLFITKSATEIEYHNFPVYASELKKYFLSMPLPGVDVLKKLGQDALDEQAFQITDTHSKYNRDKPYKPFYNNAMLRYLHNLFLQAKPFSKEVKWYQKVQQGNKSFRTNPCQFSGFKPYLHFIVVMEEGRLHLQTWIEINGTKFSLDSFKRYHFLLESNGEFFILAYNDYLILEWILAANPQQYAFSPNDFAQHILVKLEDGYTVNRNSLFSINEVDVLPKNRVVLSEISKSFLVFTPQWDYDGLLVEGSYQPMTDIVQRGETFSIKRNEAEEKTFVNLLQSLHPNFPKQLNGTYHVSFAEAQKKHWFFKAYHQLLALDVAIVGMDMLEHFRYSPHKVSTEMQVKKQEGDMLVLLLKISFGNEEVPLPELQKMLLAGQKAILLKDGSLGLPGDEWMQQYGTIIKHGKITGKEIQVAKWMALFEQDASEETQVLKAVIGKDWWAKWQQWQQPETILYAVPTNVKANLRPYQQKGYEWLMLLAEANAGACLADDMGLGKTLQTICFLANRAIQYPTSKHLIVCPSSLIYNWQQELEKFTPHLKSIVFHGPSRNLADLTNDNIQVIITSYGTVRVDISPLQAIMFGTVVLDESHNIKNPAALITQAVGQLQAGQRVALSGTPVMNNTFDLYSQLNFLLPGMFGSQSFFKREYADAIDKDRDVEKIKALQKMTAPFILRRTKEQVAPDLPEKTESILWCNMSAQQKTNYDEIKDGIRSSIFLDIKANGLGKSKLALLQGIMKLRQICNSPMLLPAEERTCTDSVKTNMLVDELANNLIGQKVLIFSQFKTMLDLLGEAFTKKGLAYYQLDGSTDTKKRMLLVNDFQTEGNTVNIFLISLKAGNAGLNLTAASYVFLFDPWWNTAVEQQAIDRTHRIGQKQKVFAYKMICKDTIEEKIINLQQRKKQTADELISEEDGFVKNLNEEDVAYLFG